MVQIGLKDPTKYVFEENRWHMCSFFLQYKYSGYFHWLGFGLGGGV